MRNPVVSVVMATFNEPAAMVSQAIGSVLRQSMDNLELLILDDSTKSETIEAIDRLAAEDGRVRVVRQEGRMGFVRALNTGLEMARGRYIARIDGDDIMMPERLEHQVAWMNDNPDVSVVGGAMDIIDGEGSVTGHRDYPAGGAKAWMFSVFRSPLAHPTVMMRREIVDAGIRYDAKFTKAEDLELWLRLMRKGYKLSNMPETLLRFRVVGNLAEKRDRKQFGYNNMARRKNFSWRRPVWSIASVMVSGIYTLLPKWFVATVYEKM
jgi:glycosyltransferase involved in cell wall biosynthesis